MHPLPAPHWQECQEDVGADQVVRRAGSGADPRPSVPSPGEVAPVQGTAFDLRTPVLLGRRLQELGLPGFDHNFCLDRSGQRRLCARWVPRGRVWGRAGCRGAQGGVPHSLGNPSTEPSD